MKSTSHAKQLGHFVVMTFFCLFVGKGLQSFAQTQDMGNFKVSVLPNWSLSTEKGSGEYYIYINNLQKIEVAFKKEPTPCLNSAEFTKLILPVIQTLQKEQWIIEQRKPAVPYSFAGQNTCHYMKLKSRPTGQQKFFLNPVVKEKMYQIEISTATLMLEPPAEALYFVSQVSTTDSQANAPKKSQFETSVDPAIAISVASDTKTNSSADDLSGYTKVKEPQPAPQKEKPDNNSSKSNDQSSKTGSAVPSASNSQSGNSPSVTASVSPTIEKGNLPDIKFSVTDPCVNGGNTDGLPWDSKKSANKIEIPKGVEAVTIPVIPNLKSLSDMSYNAAVSTAFEAMRLVYGSMSDDEAKKFEAAWSPLFDFPTQEVIDYLNKLNPLVSQFLACRESYVRSLTDMQSTLLDASVAVELKERYAWESAISNARLTSSGLMPLEAAMRQLAQQIDVLGNPPNPIAAKCDARNRYKKAFGKPAVEYPFEGEWTDSEGGVSLLKVIYSYDDGQALVYLYPVSWVKEMEAKGFKMDVMGPQTTSEGSSTLSLPGIADLVFTFEQIVPGKWVAKNTYSMFFDVYGYLVNGNNMSTHHYIPPGGLANTKLTKTKSSKTNVCPEKAPVFPTYKKSWEDLVEMYEKGAAKERERYSNWRKDAGEQIQTVLEGDLEKQKRKAEYESKKKGIQTNYEYAVQMYFGDTEEQQAAKQANQHQAEVNRAESMQQLDAEYADIVKPGNYEVTTPAPKAPENTEDMAAKKLEAERLEQEKKDAIEFHTEMVQLVTKNLEREIADRNQAIQTLSGAKTPQEVKNQEDRIKEMNLRIINIQSQIQSEQDLVTSYKTGQVVHTRTAFDDYALNKMIHDMKENAARVDATRRIAQRIDRQIELLPEEIRERARETVRNNIDGKAIASGDIEKAKKLANSITNQVQAYAEYDGAMAKVAEVDAQQNEFFAQTTIMATGAVFMGLGSAALAETFGAEAAMTIYGTQALGAVWGGTTGYLAGGPKEAVTQAVSWWSPAGYAAVQFVEGYHAAGTQSDATTATKIWNGVEQAGTAMFLGKVFEMGTRIVTKGSLMAFGNESRLFKPVVQTPSQRSKQVVDAMRTTQKIENAKDEVKTFQKLESELAILKGDPIINPQKIAQKEAELNQLAAGLNASYYSKWLLKYKADPLTRSKFDRRVQGNYSEMTPGMTRRLEQQGYNMEGIEFRQFRNASSGGTSSMDLDLGPVLKGTMKEPGINGMIRKKDGSFVTMEQFMKDGQQAMNAEYKQLHGITAPSSDMNLVTSVHKEAFSTPKLLDKNVDFSTIKPEEIASIGKVLEVKMKGISDNIMLTKTTKLQAQCRESSKEIENMLIKKLQQDLANAEAGSTKQKLIQKDINYWEDMLKRFKQIGSEETDPMKIIQLNREILKETGGKDVTGVINDLIITFKIKPSKS